MNDRVVGIFEDRAEADQAQADLVAGGIDPSRTTVRHVLAMGHRGVSEVDRVHDLIHAPEIREENTVSDDAGTLVLVVDVPASQDGATDDERQEILDALERLGATETYVVKATPGLDL